MTKTALKRRMLMKRDAQTTRIGVTTTRLRG
jgi:hypothetical protein